MISREQVEHIAKLARIKLSEQEVEKFQKDFSEILKYFEVLTSADTSNVEPMTHSVLLENVKRRDVTQSCEENIPKGEYVKVPRVL